MTTRPKLTPAIADVRRAVRDALGAFAQGSPPSGMPLVTNVPARPGPAVTNGNNQRGGSGIADVPVAHSPVAHVLVALSGGPDSLALAAATAFEARRAGLRAGAVIVNHGLQPGSAEIAERAAAQARELWLDPVVVKTVAVGLDGGPEAAARTARYAALAEAATEFGASAVLLGHTLDDQAETVLLGLARGSGASSLSGMAPVNGLYRRPLLGIRRAMTRQFCEDSGLTPWHDPHNDDTSFARVRARTVVLPVLERELGPGIADALARTADQAREDAEALDHFAAEQVEELAEHAEAGLSLSAAGLGSNPAALRQRIIRLAVLSEFGVSLSRAQTLAVGRLVTEWKGQGALDLPGVRVVREGGRIVFSAREVPPSPPTGGR